MLILGTRSDTYTRGSFNTLGNSVHGNHPPQGGHYLDFCKFLLGVLHLNLEPTHLQFVPPQIHGTANRQT